MRRIWTKIAWDRAPDGSLVVNKARSSWYWYDGPLAWAMTDPALDQDHFRYYEPGTETGSTAIDNEDTDITRTTANPFQVRILLQESAGGDTGNATYKLRVSKNAGAYVNVTASSSDVQVTDDTNIADDAATTSRLAGGTGTFIAGRFDDVDGATTTSVRIRANEHSELLWSVTIVDADVSDLDTLDFRVYDSDDTVISGAYNVTGRVTVDKAGAASTTEVSDPQVLTLAPAGPTIRTGASVIPQAPQGVLVQPQGPTIRTGASVLVAGPQPIVLQTQGPTIQSGVTIPVGDPQAIVLQPQGPTISITGPTVVSDAVVLTLQPQGPAIQAGASVFVGDPQGLTLVPHGPTIRRGASVLVDNALALLIQALDPTLLSGVTIRVADAQPIVIQPQGPAIQAGSAVFVESPASLVIQPQGPTVRTGASVIVEDPLGLLLSPQGPAVQSGVSVSVSDAQVITLTIPGPTIDTPGAAVTGAEVEDPVMLTLMPLGPTIDTGEVAVARRYSVHRGKGTRFSKGVRDHVYDVGDEAVSVDSENVE